ncbi:hypothetical protein [Nonomuraea sp. KM88]|uniref:hypothetical protein n=1 Tax=Nonomuraea sp. KM88 TaxID=3457427 RepID=UPI003FCD8DD2
MTRYRVHITETYADDADHPWSVTRHITAATGAHCQRPVQVNANGQRRVIACGQRLPADRQCDACRARIDVIEVRRQRG